MTNKQFMAEVCRLYHKAKGTHPRFKIDNVVRGRNHTVSSLTEDLLAFYLSKRLSKRPYSYWVDYPISFRSGKPGSRLKTIYADIAIVKNVHSNPTIVHIIDLKMDLGWKRDLTNTLKNAVSINKSLKKLGCCKCNYQLEGVWVRSEVRISPKLEWHIVTVSDQNGSKKLGPANLVLAKKLKPSGLNFYILSSSQHPNGGIPKLNHVDFKSMLSNLS